MIDSWALFLIGRMGSERCSSSSHSLLSKTMTENVDGVNELKKRYFEVLEIIECIFRSFWPSAMSKYEIECRCLPFPQCQETAKMCFKTNPITFTCSDETKHSDNLAC